ncbi:hypothetical protein PsB1_1600 [Candidatus Phycosocius spiralis]|uniref:Uncharacterized protein n=1 Tax=Candidatus Phycosocius spiralis TaxID=2815099 RepID=A0ABQ4PWU0_9PROT|nr:hypothetical protein PsB1_1600 [Candidatus Phycosocius spiralis]
MNAVENPKIHAFQAAEQRPPPHDGMGQHRFGGSSPNHHSKLEAWGTRIKIKAHASSKWILYHFW